jgi:hypothetical protein
MILLTPDLRARLLANGRRRGLDHEPVAKFFNPLGAATWLATELNEDGTLYTVSPILASGRPSQAPSACPKWNPCAFRSTWASSATSKEGAMT